MPQYFSIQTAQTSGGNYVVTAQSSNDGGQSPLVLLWSQHSPTCMDAPPASDGQTFASQQWMISWDGYISSATNPKLFLTVGSNVNGVVTATTPQDGAYPTVTLAGFNETLIQQWVILPGGDDTIAAIATKQSFDQYLAAKGKNPPSLQVLNLRGAGSPFNGQWLITYSADLSDLSANELWSILPCFTVIDQWTTIRSLQSPDGKDALVTLPMKESRQSALSNGTWSTVIDIAPENTQAVAATRVGGGGGSTWQLNSSGCLVCSWNSDFVLTAGLDSNGNLDGTVWVFPQLSSPPPNQIWIVPERGVLVSQATQSGQTCALTVPMSGDPAAPTLGGQLTMTPYTQGSPTAEQKWDFFPGLALQTLLVQPPVAFPELDNSAYQTVESLLWPTKTLKLPGGETVTVGGPPAGGLRRQYTNLAAPLAGYQAQLVAIALNNPELASVARQLATELQASQAVQAVFQQLTLMALELTQAQSLVLDDIAVLAKITPSTPLKTKFKWQQLVMGIVYTALNVVASGLPIGAKEEASVARGIAGAGVSAVANLLQTSFNSVQLKGEQTQQTDPTANTYAELEQTLFYSFEQMLIEIARIERMVLTDWRKLEIFSQMTMLPSGVDSLFWPSTATPSLARKLLPGYIQKVLQALLPTQSNIKINSWTFDGYVSSSLPPVGLSMSYNNSSKSAQYVLWNTYMENGSESNSPFLTYNKYTTNISDKLFQYLLESETNLASYFLGVNGWQVPISEQKVTDGVIIIVQNATNAPVTLCLRGAGIDGQWGGGDNGNYLNFYPAFGPYALVFAGVQEVSSQNYDFDQCSVEFWSTDGSTMYGYATINPQGLQNTSQPGAGYQIGVEQDTSRNPWVFTVTWSFQS